VRLLQLATDAPFNVGTPRAARVVYRAPSPCLQSNEADPIVHHPVPAGHNHATFYVQLTNDPAASPSTVGTKINFEVRAGDGVYFGVVPQFAANGYEWNATNRAGGDADSENSSGVFAVTIPVPLLGGETEVGLKLWTDCTDTVHPTIVEASVTTAGVNG
jgi:hypothetical protein